MAAGRAPVFGATLINKSAFQKKHWETQKRAKRLMLACAMSLLGPVPVKLRVLGAVLP
jgi:hypothetical protein